MRINLRGGELHHGKKSCKKKNTSEKTSKESSKEKVIFFVCSIKNPPMWRVFVFLRTKILTHTCKTSQTLYSIMYTTLHSGFLTGGEFYTCQQKRKKQQRKRKQKKRKNASKFSFSFNQKSACHGGFLCLRS